MTPGDRRASAAVAMRFAYRIVPFVPDAPKARRRLVTKRFVVCLNHAADKCASNDMTAKKYRNVFLSSVLLAGALASGHAFAGTCESNFNKQGNAFTGTTYRSSVALADLTVASAINQMQAIAKSQKMTVLAADTEGGSLLIEEPESFSHKPIPMIVTATNERGATTVQMEVKLNAGAFAKAESIKTEICKMLTQVQAGAAGDLVVKQKNDATSDAPEKMEALMFSLMIARQAKENQSTINARYKDRLFTLSGRAAFIMEDGDVYNIGYDIPEPGDMLIKPGPMDPQFKVGVSCLMAKNQTAYTLSLREGNKVSLTGRFSKYDQFRHTVWLENCARAQ